MLTAITLENFKGISERVTIPIRPLTIMFGKNSAGKSTVVQALHYAREIFERNNLNADRTLLGGAAVDLGGFRNLVNSHDESKAVTIGFQMDLSSTDLPDYEYSPTLGYQGIKAEVGEDIESRELNILSGRLKSAENELKIEYSDSLKRPILTSYQIRLNEIEAVLVETSADEKDVRIVYNANHPLLFSPEDSEERATPEIDWQPIKINNYDRTLPGKGEVLIMADGTYDQYGEMDDILLTQMLVGTTDLIREQLHEFRYLGPLRDVPPRSFQPTLTENESDWSNGLAAWRELYFKEDFFFDLNVSVWLTEKLKTGYRAELKQFREIPLESELMIALTNKTVFDDIADTAAEIRKFPVQRKLVLIEEKTGLEVSPPDIGVGISQVVPVVVAAIASTNRIVAVEQPELHLHPAMQAELGDLFIESALGDSKNFFLIETHSEHLILRILRRIRETTRGKAEKQINPEEVSLLFVGEINKQLDFLNLRIDKNGRIIDRVPGGFFEEDFAEIF